MKYILFIFTLTLMLTGCAIAPLSTGTTGRALEKGETEISNITMVDWEDDANVVPTGQVIYGLTGNMDVGVKTELKTFSLISKYSFINSEKKNGFSMAVIGSIIAIDQDYSYYGGLIGSYLYFPLEPYAAARYNVVNFDPGEHDRTFFSDPANLHFSFPSYAAGLRYWLNPVVSLGLEFTILGKPSDQTDFARHTVTGFQFSILL